MLPPPSEVTDPLRLVVPLDAPRTGLRFPKKLPDEAAASAVVCRDGMKGFGGGGGPPPSFGEVCEGNWTVRGERPAEGGGESTEWEKELPLPLEVREAEVAIGGAKVATKRSAMGVRVGAGEAGFELL